MRVLAEGRRDVGVRVVVEPVANFGLRVGGVVVHHQVQLPVGVGAVDLPQERQEFLVAVLRLDCRGHLSSRDLQRGEQGGGAVAFVVVGAAFDLPRLRREHGCGPEPGSATSRPRTTRSRSRAAPNFDLIEMRTESIVDAVAEEASTIRA